MRAIAGELRREERGYAGCDRDRAGTAGTGDRARVGARAAGSSCELREEGCDAIVYTMC